MSIICVLKILLLNYITQKAYEELSMHRSYLKKDDVLISIVGTVGESAIVTSERKATCSCKIAILRAKDKSILPEVLLVFVKTKYGKNQIQKFKRGAVQTGFLLEDFGQLYIPVFSYDFQSKIRDMVFEIKNLLQKSKRMYNDAQAMLERELGYEGYVEPREVYSTKSFSEVFGSTERMDSEYYQKRYDDLFDKLGKTNTCRLSEIVKIKKSIEPGSEVYCDEGIPFVRVSDLSKYGISEPSIKIPQDVIPDMEALFLKQDTILLSKDGSVGIAYKVDKDCRMVTSSALLHLTVCSDSVLPDYLTLALNSRIVQMQAERDSGGSVIQHWKPSSIEQISIPLLDMEKQEQFSGMVQKSFELKKQSERLLSNAIIMVETAIEHSEAEALKMCI